MRPKPTREWVMIELERLQVRVVSGRLGRKGNGEDDEDEEPQPKSGLPPITDPALLRRDSLLSGRRDSLLGTRRDSITGLLSAADMAGSSMNRNNSLGMFGGDTMDLMQRRSSSLGLSLLPDDLNRRNSSLNLSSVLDVGDPSMPPHRPLVGGGSAAAYEAARADHYTNMATQKARNDDQQRRASGLGGIGGSQMGLSVNPNQHYEMLKLHHMNLLNEIQETTLMMNLYQQQQLQQQQQQLHQQADTSGSDQMALLLQHQGMGAHGRMGSLGLGGGGNAAAASGDMQALLRQQQQMMSGGSGLGNGSKDSKGPAVDDEAALQQRLHELKAEIARAQKEAANASRKSGRSGDGEKRKLEDDGEGERGKRAKGDDSDSD